MKKSVCIIITAWNQIEKTLECLQTVVDQSYSDFDIILVDNGSEVELEDSVKKLFPMVKILTNPVNLGFAKGYNVGLVHGLARDYDFFFLLNNDTLLAPDCLGNLANSLNNKPDVILVTAKIYYESDPKRIWSVGNQIHPLTLDLMAGGKEQQDHGEWEETRDIDFAPFCGVLLKRSALEKVGLLDEEFFLYYEDMDYCRRLRINEYRLQFVPTALIWHNVSTSSGGQDSPLERYWMAQSSGRYFRKHGCGWRMFFIIPFRIGSAIKMTVKLAFKWRWWAMRSYWLGLYIGWKTGKSITVPPTWVIEKSNT